MSTFSEGIKKLLSNSKFGNDADYNRRQSQTRHKQNGNPNWGKFSVASRRRDTLETKGVGQTAPTGAFMQPLAKNL